MMTSQHTRQISLRRVIMLSVAFSVVIVSVVVLNVVAPPKTAYLVPILQNCFLNIIDVRAEQVRMLF